MGTRISVVHDCVSFMGGFFFNNKGKLNNSASIIVCNQPSQEYI